MAATTRICEDCCFFKKASFIAEDKDGWCQRYPPQRGGEIYSNLHAEFPAIGNKDWCGEFESALLSPMQQSTVEK